MTILRAVITLVALYILGYLLIGMAVVISGTDLVTGFSASLACLGNIGPGFGAVGPMANYAFLPVGAKVILTLAMWIGRLEIVAVLALLHPDVWKNLQLYIRRPGLRTKRAL
jgi:trk system potassium uptake protein TrkH